MTLLGRIIPAHAGFTMTPPGTLSGTRDHPRTRGVYVNALFALADAAGSSPHTRGLPVKVATANFEERIIPAHAGFTHAGQVIIFQVQDHPRTRGVYALLSL